MERARGRGKLSRSTKLELRSFLPDVPGVRAPAFKLYADLPALFAWTVPLAPGGVKSRQFRRTGGPEPSCDPFPPLLTWSGGRRPADRGDARGCFAMYQGEVPMKPSVHPMVIAATLLGALAACPATAAP